MKKSSLFFVFFLGVAGLVTPGLSRTLWADEDPEQLVTQAWMKEALNKIDERLSVIEENQNKILDGENKLSEEHKQLRYWVHKK